jgi:hypothetical protein
MLAIRLCGRAMDVNGDGEVSATEFVQAQMKQIPVEQHEVVGDLLERALRDVARLRRERRGTKHAFLCAMLYSKRSICQDRLGPNIGES